MATFKRFFSTDIKPDSYVKQCSYTELLELQKHVEKALENQPVNTFTHDSNLTMQAAEKE